MARKPNYDFQKRQREMERQKKKDAKARKKAEQGERALDEYGNPVEYDELGNPIPAEAMRAALLQSDLGGTGPSVGVPASDGSDSDSDDDDDKD